MRHIVIAELDAEVIRMSRAHLQAVHQGALDDPRVIISIGDGWDTTEALARDAAGRFSFDVENKA